MYGAKQCTLCNSDAMEEQTRIRHKILQMIGQKNLDINAVVIFTNSSKGVLHNLLFLQGVSYRILIRV
jgi:hypothetical protein